MSHQFSLFDLLILLGIIQGVITSFLLLKSKKNPQSNRFLALGLLSFCMLSTKPLLHTLSLWDTHWFRFFPNAMELAVAPLIYFYVKALVIPKFKFKKKDWLHFVPFFISQAYSFVVYFLVLQTRNFSEKDQIASNCFFSEMKQLDEYILLFATIIYLYQAYQILLGHKQWLETSTSDTSLPEFKWLKNLFQLFAFTGITLLTGRVVSLLTYFQQVDFGDYYWKFISLYVAFLIYYLGVKGYLQPQYLFSGNVATESEPIAITVPQQKPDTKAISTKIERAMVDDKAFLDSKLSIQALSAKIGVPQRVVSFVINQDFNTNFREFVNQYRIEEVKARLRNQDHQHLSTFGVAQECGFNSEASFYRLFKKHVGMTPKEFLDQEITC